MSLPSLLAFACVALTAHAADWPQFRGPSGQGLSEATNPPTQWSADSNIRWKTPIPGSGWSSPVTWGDRVFLTTAVEDGVRCHVICLSLKSGEILWDREVLEQVPMRKEGKNSHATPTPVVDGSRVFAVFGDGSAVALDFEGKILWTNRETRFYSRHGLGASPVLHDGLLIMPYDGSNRVATPGSWPNNTDEERLGWQMPWDRAEIVALDAATGKRVWVAKRGKSRIAHVTPNILKVNGKAQLVSPAGDVIQGFEPKTGELIWTARSQGEGVTPGFAFGDGLIFTSSGFEKTTLRTVRTGGVGDVTDSHIAWEERKGAPTQPSLLHVAPHLYTITDGGIVHCYESATGKIVYQERVGGNHCASPVLVDGLIYFLSEAGETTIIRAGPKFEIVARNNLGERCQASIAPGDGFLLIRSERHLYCVGE
jgi:outer membrane protein assembly factor BamB